MHIFMSKILNKWDILVIVSTAILSVGLYFCLNLFVDNDASVAHVYYDNQLVASLDLNVDDTVTLQQSKYQYLLADLEVEVKDGRVRISKETSPNNICSKQGWTDSSTKPLVCLPNKVYVQIESETQQNDGGDVQIQ